jgi:antitoxin component YwqK of YwqJK toxin-antitoxin module
MKKILFTVLVFLTTFTFSLANTIENEKVTKTYEDGTTKEVVYKYDTYYKRVVYFENGDIQEIGYFDADGKKNGKWIMYNKNKVVIAEANYKNGQKHGEWKIYNNEGRMTIYMVYKNGVRKSACSWSEEKGLIVKS